MLGTPNSRGSESSPVVTVGKKLTVVSDGRVTERTAEDYGRDAVENEVGVIMSAWLGEGVTTAQRLHSDRRAVKETRQR